MNHISYASNVAFRTKFQYFLPKTGSHRGKYFPHTFTLISACKYWSLTISCEHNKNINYILPSFAVTFRFFCRKRTGFLFKLKRITSICGIKVNQFNSKIFFFFLSRKRTAVWFFINPHLTNKIGAKHNFKYKERLSLVKKIQQKNSTQGGILL